MTAKAVRGTGHPSGPSWRRSPRASRTPAPASRGLALVLIAAVVLIVASCGGSKPGGGTAGSAPPVAGESPAPPASIPSALPGDLPSDTSVATDRNAIVVGQPGDTEDATTTGNRPTITFRGTDPWQIQRPSTSDHPTEAYTDAPSYLPGDVLRLAVSTDSATYTVDVYRLGATVQSMSASAAQPGVRQGGPIVDPITKMVRAGWRYTYSQSIPADWPSGVYFGKVSGVGGTQSYVPFVIRSTRPARYLFVSNTLDYAAYDRWGGSSLYWTSVGEPAPGISQAVAVSLDRPFDTESGAGKIFMMEAPLITWLETNHVDVTYTTDYDLSTHPADQPVPKAVIFSGHGEYWGAQLRDWLDAHVLVGGDMGLAVFAADTGYWQVTLSSPSSTGPRTIGLYKDGRSDPAALSRCPGGVTKWANAFRTLPCGHTDPAVNRPEQALFGVQYGSVVPDYFPYRLAAEVPAALLSGTGLSPGDSLGLIAGGEVDHVWPGVPTLPGDRVFASTMTVTEAGGTTEAQAVVRTLPSGGHVFASGTFWWAWGLEPGFAASQAVPAGFGQLTANLLTFVAGG